MPSLDKILNGVPSNDASSSFHDSTTLGTQKMKITLGTQSTIERIKNKNLLRSGKEGTTHARAKYSAMSTCSRGKEKGARLTARAEVETKKRGLATKHQSAAPENLRAKEDDEKRKE